ncbi:MAG: DUF4199 domain-containing protein [Ferruginibacter sp.]|nr:DUF4199 domain-containing protein [Cytophagales bacterium]
METTTKPSTAGIALKYGAIAALVSIIYGTIMQIAGLATDPAMTVVSFVVSVGIFTAAIVYAMKDFKSQSGGYMSYGEGLGLGSLLSAVAGLISSAFSAIYIGFIDDSSMKKSMAMQRQAMEQQGQDDAQIDQAMAMAERFTGPGFIFFFGFLASLFLGFILSLIIAAVMKKDRMELEMDR